MAIEDDYNIIYNSNKFDEEFYRLTYNIPENIDAIYHYLLYGVDKNFNPSKNFDTKFYLDENPDVKNAKVNPFVHYILWGKNEGRVSKLLDFEEIKIKYIYKCRDLISKNGNVFQISDSNSELLQHFDSKFKYDFKKNLFSKNLLFKKNLFNNHGIKYDFFIIPDKSVICKNSLPFKYDFFNRVIDDLELHDFTDYLNETHYSKFTNQINLNGGKLIFSKIISLLDNGVSEEKINYWINHHKLELFKCSFAQSTVNSLNIGEGKEIFVPKPLYLNEIDVPMNIFGDYNSKLTYFFNADSFSDSRVLIFYNSNIDMLKYYLSFYFREVLLFYDYGALNRKVIKWFNPDFIFEIRTENYIPFYNDPIWINHSIDFLENFEVTSKQLDLINVNDESNKKISVIIPVFNVEKYLEQCLESVIKQTFEDIEIICVNDGSSDNSLDILKKYAKIDNRIKIINTTNHGLGAARNYGLKQATGKYILFLDSDDWIREDSLQLLYDKAVKSDLDMVFYQLINYIDYDGALVKNPIYDHACFIDNHLDEKEFFTYEDILDHLFEIPVSACSKLYKKSFILDNKFKFPEGILYEDNEFFYNAFLNCGKAGFLKEYLLYRRRHPESITGGFNERQVEMILAMNNTISVFNFNSKYDIFKQKLINHTFANVVSIFNSSPLYFKQYFYDKIKNEFFGFGSLRQDFEKYLTKNHKLIFDVFNKNKYYINFDSEYHLSVSEYEIYYKNKLISYGSEEYHAFKRDETCKHYKIGVIIPIYNNGFLTHRTMMSLENQTFNFNDIEVILINDNSNDETFDIINNYAEKYSNVKAIHMSKSSGSSGTPRNVGIRECSADYMMFLDHDDFFELDALEKLYSEIILTNSDVVFGTYSVISRDRITKQLEISEKHGYFENLSENERLVAIPAPSIWTKLFNTHFIKQHNILFPTILGEDAIFMVDVFVNATGIKYLWHDNICYHDLRDSSTTNNISLSYMQELFVSELYMYNYFESINKPQFSIYRGINIIDFALNQLCDSNLSNDELMVLFNLMKEFILVHDSYGSRPKSFKNKILFSIILSGDFNSLIHYMRFNESELDVLKRDLDEFKENYGTLKNENDKLNIIITSLKKENKLLKSNLDFNSKMDHDPLLSIIIPIFNKEKHIEECISSIFEQTYTNIEVICIDDCSSDNSLDIIKNLSNRYPNIRVIQNNRNLGPGWCRNKGLDVANGEYVFFLDADDYIVDNNSFKKYIDVALKYGVPMVSGNLEYIRDGKIEIENKYLKHIVEFNIKKPEEYGIPWYFTRNLYKMDFLKKNGISFPESRFGEDPIFLTNVLLNIDFYVEIPVQFYRYRASNIVKKNTFEKFCEDIKNISIIFNLLIPYEKYYRTLNIFSKVFISRLDIDNYVCNINEFSELKRLYDEFLDILKNNGYDSLYEDIRERVEINLENTKVKLKDI